MTFETVCHATSAKNNRLNNVTISLPSEALFWVRDIIEDEAGKNYRVTSRRGTAIELGE